MCRGGLPAVSRALVNARVSSPIPNPRVERTYMYNEGGSIWTPEGRRLGGTVGTQFLH